ncbi:glutamate racemase [bacterium]|nr:glutamate racemase [bacterium]
MDNRPMGVFDSGVGGLSVVKEVYNQLPQENIVYFGDTAHLPYGPKTSQTIKRLVRDNVRFLLKKKVKAIILACHTASAFTLEEIREDNPVPIIGVIGPGAEEALRVTKNKRIGVIGTYGTIRSKAYTKTLKRLEPEVFVIEKPCPLFVPLAEEGWVKKEATRLIIREYLEPLKEEEIDTLILGCTHYPLLKEEIARATGGIYLVDSARATVIQVKKILEEKNLLAREGVSKRSFFVSDAPERFARLGRIFLGKEIEKVERVE